MIDSGSVSTFIDKSVSQRLKLNFLPKSKTFAFADLNQTAKITGEVVIDVQLNSHTHSRIHVKVIDNLFVELIVGKDIMKEHRKVTFNFQGPRDELMIGALSDNAQHFSEMKVPPPPLFTNMTSNVKPVTTKSCRYTKSDFSFIKTETEKLLKEDVIEPSVSPWRAQVLYLMKTIRNKWLSITAIQLTFSQN